MYGLECKVHAFKRKQLDERPCADCHAPPSVLGDTIPCGMVKSHSGFLTRDCLPRAFNHHVVDRAASTAGWYRGTSLIRKNPPP